LAQHRVESNQFSVEFLLKQKKEFQFKKQKTEIGGDICIAHSVQLRGKQHLVFLNADAMGKSIQGAGGALVVGSVFGSIIERTKIVESYKNFYPEQWLSAVFHELQKIFESFDYSMLVSMLLGIVEDEVGLLYYINAEHPSLVVYRDNTTEFIENKYHYFKLGTTPQNKLAINTFQLKPGDVIIAGSDGRDDIYLPPDEAGNRDLNYDEKLFLRHVKNGKGKLNGIYESIIQSGELSDDLSLIRLEYVVPKKYYKNRYNYEVAQFILKYKQEMQTGANYLLAMAYLHVALILNDSSPIVIKELMRLHLMYKNYKSAISFAEKYLQIDPNSNETLFSISYAYKKIRDFEKAISFSERLRLREPNLIRNLFHLVILYLKTENRDKAYDVYLDIQELGRYDLKLKRIYKLLKMGQND
jgi:hypothetical protein